MTPLDVLCFGEVIIDFLPEDAGRLLRDVERFARHFGGAPANVAVGLARLGAAAGLMTLVGDDEFGAFLRAGLEREGVDIQALGVHATARTGIAFVSLGPRGERSFLFYRHPSADQLITEDDVDPAALRRARVFHYGSSTMSSEPTRAATRKALREARAAGLVTSSDPNLRTDLWRDPEEAARLVREALAATDIVKVSEEELPPLARVADPVEGAHALRRLGAGLAVVTLGERGCWFDGESSGAGQVLGTPVVPVDTTGAGDGFMAGLLAELVPAFARGGRPATLDRQTVMSACAFANRVASCVVGRLGATAALPRRDEL